MGMARARRASRRRHLVRARDPPSAGPRPDATAPPPPRRRPRSPILAPPPSPLPGSGAAAASAARPRRAGRRRGVEAASRRRRAGGASAALAASLPSSSPSSPRTAPQSAPMDCACAHTHRHGVSGESTGAGGRGRGNGRARTFDEPFNAMLGAPASTRLARARASGWRPPLHPGGQRGGVGVEMMISHNGAPGQAQGHAWSRMHWLSGREMMREGGGVGGKPKGEAEPGRVQAGVGIRARGIDRVGGIGGGRRRGRFCDSHFATRAAGGATLPRPGPSRRPSEGHGQAG